jgi:hypothetical protein
MDPGSSGRLEDEDDDKGKPRIINYWPFLLLLLIYIYIYTHGYSSIHIAYNSMNAFLNFYFFIFHCSSWFQVTCYIKNCAKIYKTCD